jgi:hypothetical protein
MCSERSRKTYVGRVFREQPWWRRMRAVPRGTRLRSSNAHALLRAVAIALLVISWIDPPTGFSSSPSSTEEQPRRIGQLRLHWGLFAVVALTALGFILRGIGDGLDKDEGLTLDVVRGTDLSGVLHAVAPRRQSRRPIEYTPPLFSFSPGRRPRAAAQALERRAPRRHRGGLLPAGRGESCLTSAGHWPGWYARGARL